MQPTQDTTAMMLVIVANTNSFGGIGNDIYELRFFGDQGRHSFCNQNKNYELRIQNLEMKTFTCEMVINRSQYGQNLSCPHTYNEL
jgi:hypothetical protein